MSAAELLVELDRLGIRLKADGERLRYHPRSALTPDLLARLKAHKADLLARLRPAGNADEPAGLPSDVIAWATSAETWANNRHVALMPTKPARPAAATVQSIPRISGLARE